MALFALWYVALGAFKLAFPDCSSVGFGGKAVCLVGARDYGALYDEIVMFSSLALAPLAITFLIIFLVVESGLLARLGAGRELS